MSTTDPIRDTYGATELVATAVDVLQSRFYEPLAVDTLFRDAWDGATSALVHAGVPAVPRVPAYPVDPVAARAVHDTSFPRLEALAIGRLTSDELAAAALRELAARRRDGHTALITPRMLAARQTAGPCRDFGFVLSGPPLRVADVRPGSPAQQVGVRRGQALTAVNGEPCAELSAREALALLDTREGSANALSLRNPDGNTTLVELRGEPTPLVTWSVLPGPSGLLRVDGFAGSDEATAEFRDVLTTFEQAGALGWIVDVRWCGGGVSIGLSRLLVDHGRLFSRVRHNALQRRDGQLLPAREDIDADGTALPFQRPLVILIGPGSVSGAESFAGPLQALGRATLVGECTAGLCGMAPAFDLAPGFQMTVTAWQTVFGPQERSFNRVGVPPDVGVSPTPEDEAAGRDPQLKAAVEILLGKVHSPGSVDG